MKGDDQESVSPSPPPMGPGIGDISDVFGLPPGSVIGPVSDYE